MTLEEIIRMAREAGVVADEDNGYLELWNFAKLVAAHEREALAEQELYEPEGRCKECLAYNGHLDYCSKAAPVSAKREWVDLTDSEWMNIVNKDQAWFGRMPDEVACEVAKLIEAKLKEKNK